MIMIAALLLHNNNLGRGGAVVVLWCTGHAAAVHACHHQLSRARGCTRGCCYYATSFRSGTNMLGSRVGAFSWLKVPFSTFTLKTLLRHYAKQALTPRSLNVKLGPRRKSQKGQAVWLA